MSLFLAVKPEQKSNSSSLIGPPHHTDLTGYLHLLHAALQLPKAALPMCTFCDSEVPHLILGCSSLLLSQANLRSPSELMDQETLCPHGPCWVWNCVRKAELVNPCHQGVHEDHA